MATPFSWPSTWSKLKEFGSNKCQGVYAIAISKENLQGKKVEQKDVCYIGMTVAKRGFNSRIGHLKRVLDGKKGKHSGGSRMYRYLRKIKGTAYITVKGDKVLRVEKKRREPEDLLAMGEVVRGEYVALAWFKKKKIGEEPRFNEK